MFSCGGAPHIFVWTLVAGTLLAAGGSSNLLATGGLRTRRFRIWGLSASYFCHWLYKSWIKDMFLTIFDKFQKL